MIVITVDAILSMEVKPTSFHFLTAIPTLKKIILVIDESHSLGIVGKQGDGIFNHIHSENLDQKIMVSSLGKALGLAGGSIVGSQKFISNLKKEIAFITSSGASPAHLETYIQTQDIYKEQYKKLQDNLHFFFSNLATKKPLKFNAKYPVIYSSDTTLFYTLLQQHIIMTHFNYPTENNIVNRIVITANHTLKDLEKLLLILNKL